MDKFIETQDRKFKRIFTIKDLNNLFNAGILSDDESVELIEGEILQRLETIPDELQKTKKIIANLAEAFGDKAMVKAQHPINLYEI